MPRHQARVAIREPGHADLSYAALDQLSARVRDGLHARGVGPGDRVAICLPKSADAVAAMLGVLRAGAAYVPVDPGWPAWRAAYVMADCAVRCAIVDSRIAPALTSALASLGTSTTTVLVERPGGGAGIARALADEPAPPRGDADVPPDALAYLLYTSGSTGKPKGVMISHRAALAFVDWCSRQFAPTEHDRFSSHAPFNFDLSVFDLYVALRHGASVTLIGDDLGKDPLKLAALIASARLTVWYSTPSILTMLTLYGHLERHDFGALRLVLFAGEVFPLGSLRALRALVPGPAYYNLYGPTETNVCTSFRLPDRIPSDRTDPFPIGWPCDHYRARVVDGEGRKVVPGTQGELVMSGPGVMSGYWNLPDRNAAAFLLDADGTRWYRTGDLVVECDDGCLLFHGRADRMVKRRGYRIELGEIEAVLARHPAVGAVAVVATPEGDAGVRITAFLTTRGDERPSLIALKQFAIAEMPRYMAPDRYLWLAALPQTSTDKTDYQALARLAAAPTGATTQSNTSP